MTAARFIALVLFGRFVHAGTHVLTPLADDYLDYSIATNAMPVFSCVINWLCKSFRAAAVPSSKGMKYRGSSSARAVHTTACIVTGTQELYHPLFKQSIGVLLYWSCFIVIFPSESPRDLIAFASLFFPHPQVGLFNCFVRW